MTDPAGPSGRLGSPGDRAEAAAVRGSFDALYRRLLGGGGGVERQRTTTRSLPPRAPEKRRPDSGRGRAGAGGVKRVRVVVPDGRLAGRAAPRAGAAIVPGPGDAEAGPGTPGKAVGAAAGAGEVAIGGRALRGVFVRNAAKVKDSRVRLDDGSLVKPGEFEEMAGFVGRKWKQNLRLAGADGELGPKLSEWLAHGAAAWGGLPGRDAAAAADPPVREAGGRARTLQTFKRKAGGKQTNRERLSQLKAKKDGDAAKAACTICMEDGAGRHWTAVAGCGHRFHKSCLTKWFKVKNSCPTCRKPVREHEGKVVPDRNVIAEEHEREIVTYQNLLANLICKECHEGEDEENMLLCDHCDGGWHMYCLDPPLEEIPEGSWYCPTCRVERGEG